MSARPRESQASGGYVMRCKIEQQGPRAFLATVTAIPDYGSTLGTPPESESRRQTTREDAYRACAEMGFDMEARLRALGFSVRDWPPRGPTRLGDLAT